MSTSADFASGKGHRDENFPVASKLIAPAYRAPIMAFYRYARLADDIADHATASPADKLAQLETMRATVAGESDADPAALALREVMAERGLDPVHALDLLEAFRRDVTQNRTADWDDLIDYCRYSAMPVGRFVLDVHGEDRATWPANDALCAALQIVNHLQDCGKDYRAIDRVYVPLDTLEAAGLTVESLGAATASPALLKVISDLAERTQLLLDQSAGFSRSIVDRRLGVEVAVIQRLAVSLAARLRRRDPLSERVHHGKIEALLLAASAALPRLMMRHSPVDRSYAVRTEAFSAELRNGHPANAVFIERQCGVAVGQLKRCASAHALNHAFKFSKRGRISPSREILSGYARYAADAHIVRCQGSREHGTGLRLRSEIIIDGRSYTLVERVGERSAKLSFVTMWENR